MKYKRRIKWIILALVILYILIPIYLKVDRLSKQRDELEDELHYLSTKNQILETKLRLLKEDPVYIEKLARKTFKKAREREIVYKIVDPEHLESP